MAITVTCVSRPMCVRWTDVPFLRAVATVTHLAPGHFLLPRRQPLMNLLHIDASVLGDHSVSRQVSAAIVAGLRRPTRRSRSPTATSRAQPLAHLSGRHLAAARGGDPMPHLRDDIAAGHAVLDEFLAADIVVIGAPMYNFTLPTQLKAWIDRILIAGKTFRYTRRRPRGSGRRQASDRRGVARRILRRRHAGRGGEHLETYLRWPCSASSASPIPTSSPPTASRSAPNTAKRR